MKDKGEIVIYKADDGLSQMEVRLSNETIWLDQYQIAQLFKTDRTSIQSILKISIKPAN